MPDASTQPNRIEKALANAPLVPDAGNQLLAALLPVFELNEGDRDYLLRVYDPKLFPFAPRQGERPVRETVNTGFDPSERAPLCAILHRWDEAAPFDKFVFFLALATTCWARVEDLMAR